MSARGTWFVRGGSRFISMLHKGILHNGGAAHRPPRIRKSGLTHACQNYRALSFLIDFHTRSTKAVTRLIIDRAAADLQYLGLLLDRSCSGSIIVLHSAIPPW